MESNDITMLQKSKDNKTFLVIVNIYTPRPPSIHDSPSDNCPNIVIAINSQVTNAQFISKGQPFSRKLMRVKMPGSGVCRHEVWPGTVTAFLQIWLHLSDASLIQIFVGPSFIMVIVISPGSKCTQLIVLIDDCGHRQILIHQSLLGMIKLDWNVQRTFNQNRHKFYFSGLEASKHENIGYISYF